MPTTSFLTTASVPDTSAEFVVDEARSLAAAFLHICAKRGDAVAVRAGADEISYSTLEHQARCLARTLQHKGAGPGSLVGIYLPRGIDMVAAMLGVCFAGAAYLPLDPNFPVARVRATLADAQPALLITEASLRSSLGEVAAPTLLARDVPQHVSDDEPAAHTRPDDLAYVIYTSGSTGRPKGVMVSQRNVLRLLSQTADWFDFSERDVWTMFHSFAFDFSVWEMWGCLLTGGILVVVSYETSRSPELLYALLSNDRVTVLNQTPTAFGLLCSAVEARDLPLSLRYVIFGGEALNVRSLRPWVLRFGDARPRLINMYGITETTVHVTYRHIVDADVQKETDSVIGEPIPDLRLYLLNENQQPVSPGEVGEMYIGGAGVALGYLHRPDLTAERFVSHPLSQDRLYRSGDLARRRTDGELVYLGRADRQVKINGFRVEPGEIEAALAECADIQQVCVTPVRGVDGTQFLAAYFVASSAVDRMEMAAAIAQRLPVHMRPTFYVQLRSLPLTVNGKVDRDALPPPEMLESQQASTTGVEPLPQRIAALWASILQIESLNESDNFFDSGGSSLQLLALRTALQGQLGKEIPVLWMFEHTTPQSLAGRLTHEDGNSLKTPAAAQTTADRQRQSFARARALRSLPS